MGSLRQQRLQDLLRQVRVDAGLRQSDLADLLGHSQSYVSKYESGELRLDLLELRQICEALDISLTHFVERFEQTKDAGELTVPKTTKKLLGKRQKH